MTTGIDAIAGLFAGPGARDYLGEAVTIGEHMRQAGAVELRTLKATARPR